MFNRIKDYIVKKITTESTPVVTTESFNLAVNNTPLPPFNYRAALKLYKNWVAVAININAARMSTLPLRLYIKAPINGQKSLWATQNVNINQMKYFNGELENKPSIGVQRKIANFNLGLFEIIDTHPILTMLNQVNTGFNQVDLMQAKIRDLQLTGNAYWNIIRNGLGVPVQIQPVPSVLMKVITSGNGFEKSIVGYKYGEGDKAIFYEYEDIIHFKRHASASSLYATGDLELGWESVWIDTEEHIFKRSKLQNMGRLDSIVSIPGANKTQLDRLKRDYNNKFKGTRNAGKTGFLNTEVKVTPLHYSDFNLAEFDPSNIREVGAIFGIPEQKLIGSSPTKANSKNQDIDWLRGTITSLANADEQKLNEALLPMFGESFVKNAFLAYDSPVIPDKIALVKKNVEYVKNGITTPNEARASEGLPPIEGGDELRVSSTPDDDDDSNNSEQEEKSISPIILNINNSSELEIEEED